MCASVQVRYMMRPGCKVRDKMLETLGDNLHKGGILRTWKTWDRIMAMVITSMRRRTKQPRREELLGRVLDGIEFMLRKNGYRRSGRGVVRPNTPAPGQAEGHEKM